MEELLDERAPRFDVLASSVDVLSEPAEFYERLKHGIRSAKSRVFLSSLYLGSSEQELVEVIDATMRQNKQLKVHVLLDGLRGTREVPAKSSAGLLTPLIEKYPTRFSLALYQTPRYSGWRKLIPKRLNEGLGLQHMKIYGFDDRVIISGANLSRDYFTNRQDRYVCVDDGNTAQYFHDLVAAVSKLSYNVRPSFDSNRYRLEWLSHAKSPVDDPRGYSKDAHRLLEPFLQPKMYTKRLENTKESATIYPVCQFTPLLGLGGPSTELPTVLALAKRAIAQNNFWSLTAGYFNVNKQLSDIILARQSSGEVILASEPANGFYESHGISKHIPGLYTVLAQKFFSRAAQANAKVQVYQWERGVHNQPNGWSYHAKGIWLSKDQSSPPFLTVVGSSNYTKRGYLHDLEAGMVIYTRNAALQQKFHQELFRLKSHAQLMTLPQTEVVKPKLMYRVFLRFLGDRL